MNSASQSQAETNRLDGLDLARFLALVGMFIVNFRVVMGAELGDDVLSFLIGALEGRAAATFVVLAGTGLGLAALKGMDQTVAVTVKRATFLLTVGLINTLIFDADIIHYYAFYFLFGVFLVGCGSRVLFAAIVLLNAVFVLMLLTLDYNRSWDWIDYSYADFWTPAGFVRNLFFNGWHPVFPWLGFLLYGLILSRLKLKKRTTQRSLMLAGAAMVVMAESLSALISPSLFAIDPELIALSSTLPVPPVPLYTLAGIGAASAVIGFCLAIAEWLRQKKILQLIAPAGRQTLTLYLAHILIGMGALEAFGLLGEQSVSAAFAAAMIFCTAATVWAYLWSRKFRRGPVETLMRRMAG